MTDDRIDISTEMEALCKRLNLSYHDVKEVKFQPDTVYATVFKRTENGGTVMVEGHAVTHTHRFKVRT